MSSPKPYTIIDARTQSEDIDLMFDELYRIGNTLDTTLAAQTRLQGPPGVDGADGEISWPVTAPIKVPIEYTITTTGNIDDLDFGNADLLRMNNASLATIRGLKSGTSGQQVTIISVGAGEVDLSHQDTNDTTANNRLFNLVTGGITPLAPDSGKATYRYDNTLLRWRLIAHEQGAAIAIPFAAGLFTGSAGTWTVESADVLSNTYYIIGRLVILGLSCENTSVAAAGSQLRYTLPNAYTASGFAAGVLRGTDSGTDCFGVAEIAANSTFVLAVRKLDSAGGAFNKNWADATNTTAVLWSLTIPIT